MIYLDTSVALAQLLAEDCLPRAARWSESLVPSRFLEHEPWDRINARSFSRAHAEPVRRLIGRIALLELSAAVLARALEPFPEPGRALDALHLASQEHQRSQGQHLELASDDDRMLAGAPSSLRAGSWARMKRGD